MATHPADVGDRDAFATSCEMEDQGRDSLFGADRAPPEATVGDEEYFVPSDRMGMPGKPFSIRRVRIQIGWPRAGVAWVLAWVLDLGLERAGRTSCGVVA